MDSSPIDPDRTYGLQVFSPSRRPPFHSADSLAVRKPFRLTWSQLLGFAPVAGASGAFSVQDTAAEPEGLLSHLHLPEYCSKALTLEAPTFELMSVSAEAESTVVAQRSPESRGPTVRGERAEAWSSHRPRVGLSPFLTLTPRVRD